MSVSACCFPRGIKLQRISIFTPFSSQTRIKLKLSYIQNYIAISNQILDNNKDHQLLFLDGPKQA